MSEAAISQAIVSKLVDSFSNGIPGFPNNNGNLIPSTLIASAVAAAATQSPESNGPSTPAQASVPDFAKKSEQGSVVDAVKNLLGDVLENLEPIIAAAKEKAQNQGGDDSDKDKVAKEILSDILKNLGQNKASNLSSTA